MRKGPVEAATAEASWEAGAVAARLAEMVGETMEAAVEHGWEGTEAALEGATTAERATTVVVELTSGFGMKASE